MQEWYGWVSTRVPLYFICWNRMECKFHQIPSAPPWNGMKYFHVIPYILIPLNSNKFYTWKHFKFNLPWNLETPYMESFYVEYSMEFNGIISWNSMESFHGTQYIANMHVI